MKNEEKSIKALYYFWKKYTLISFIGILVFTIIGALSRKVVILSVIFFSIAAICLIILIATQIACKIVEKKGWFDKLDKENWEKKKEKMNQKRKEKIFLNMQKIAEYKIVLNGLTLEKRLKEILMQFNIVIIKDGTLFYKYSPKKKAFPSHLEIYFIPIQNNVSYDFSIEETKLKEFDSYFSEYLEKELSLDVSSISCVVILPYQKINKIEKDFFYNFIGLNKIEMDGERLIYDREYNYCAIDLSSLNVYFYYPKNYNFSLEADLSQLMIKTLLLKKLSNKNI